MTTTSTGTMGWAGAAHYALSELVANNKLANPEVVRGVLNVLALAPTEVRSTSAALQAQVERNAHHADPVIGYADDGRPMYAKAW